MRAQPRAAVERFDAAASQPRGDGVVESANLAAKPPRDHLCPFVSCVNATEPDRRDFGQAAFECGGDARDNGGIGGRRLGGRAEGPVETTRLDPPFVLAGPALVRGGAPAQQRVGGGAGDIKQTYYGRA